MPGVAPDVVDGLVVLGPQPRVGGHGDEERSRRAAARAGPRPPPRRRRRCARARRRPRRGRGWRRRRGSAVASRTQHRQAALGGDRAPSAPYSRAAADQPAVAQHPGVAASGGADVQRRARACSPAIAGREQVPALAVPPVGVLERGELADLSAFHGRSSCQPPGPPPHRRAGMPLRMSRRASVTRGPGRRPRRPTWSWSARAAPSARGRAASGWRCRSRRRSRTRRRR